MTSNSCKNNHHTVCLKHYGGKQCECVCHVTLVHRRGWAKEINK